MDLFSDDSDPNTRPKVTGSCNCGRHKYTIPKAEKMNLCHCLDCRKWAGAMHSAHLFVQSKHIDNHGSPEPKTWTTNADSGTEMVRAWCDECGTGLWLKTDAKSDMTFLKAGQYCIVVGLIDRL